MGDRTYPLPATGEDPRFTFGLLVDVADVLVTAGYPKFTGLDLAALQQTLYRFLHTSKEEGRA